MYKRLKIWNRRFAPKRVLAIRLHAMGDVTITLPYLLHLRGALPEGTTIDFVTLTESRTIPQNIELFDRVYAIGGGRNFKKQFLCTCLLLPRLWLNRYEMVLDLQDAIISRFIRKCLMPKAWSTFDKVSRIPAGERSRLTIEAVGLRSQLSSSRFKIKDDFAVEKLLMKNGWDGISSLLILNPAGAFITRNWPLSNYVAFAELWLKEFPQTQFLVMGLDLIVHKAAYFKNKLGKYVIDIVNQTTAAAAFVIVQKATLVLSEDSGLMHMAWVSGVPTLALFGSTKSYWATPLGDHTRLLGSSDLPCGNCMLEECKYGDTHCLTRYSPAMVFETAASLIRP